MAAHISLPLKDLTLTVSWNKSFKLKIATLGLLMENTVEPLNKGHIGDSIYKFTCFVLCREVVLF